MDLFLCRKLNHRNIVLNHDTSGETIGVRRNDGSYRYVPWLGFISRDDAVGLQGKPVKLLAARVGRMQGPDLIWRDLPYGTHVQGCLTPKGVYAVFEMNVVVLDR